MFAMKLCENTMSKSIQKTVYNSKAEKASHVVTNDHKFNGSGLSFFQTDKEEECLPNFFKPPARRQC